MGPRRRSTASSATAARRRSPADRESGRSETTGPRHSGTGVTPVSSGTSSSPTGSSGIMGVPGSNACFTSKRTSNSTGVPTARPRRRAGMNSKDLATSNATRSSSGIPELLPRSAASTEPVESTQSRKRTTPPIPASWRETG